MIVFLPVAVSGARVQWTSTGPATAFGGAQGYVGTQVFATTSAPASSDSFSGGVRRTAGGALRIFDATAGLPSDAVRLGGFAFRQDGRLCVAFSDPDARLSGVPVKSDGRVCFA